MKKKFVLIFFAIFIVITALFLAGGFRKRTDVVLRDYSISKDGKIMTLNIDIASSAGYARDLKVKQGGDNKYITFYSTFGFLNSKIGAKNEYQIELNPSCTEIYFYKGDGGYNLVLQKDEATNEWKKADNQEQKQDTKYDIDMPISMSVKDGTLTPKGATIILKNNTDKAYWYEPAYNIEKKEDNKWSEIILDEPLTWNSVIFILEPGEEKEISIEWSNTGYGILEKRQYRLIKKNFREKESLSENGFEIYAEFEIKD